MPNDFIRDMIEADVAAGKHGGKVATRFPPEPNGYLHIGHAKAICLNFGVAAEFKGTCNLRMDDTNPTAEDPEYVEAIQRDVRWLGFDWVDRLHYASDYYGRLYELAEKLIRLGRAYVCDLTEDRMAEYRGTITEPGKDSPFRARSVEENLDLFRRMKAGELAEGSCVLRARIDMASPNMKMRDPPLYRIKHAHHYRTGDAWCLYPLYDYAHCLSDSFEGITHSLCTLEFESARELYDWVVAATEVPHVPRQTEFARLNLTYTVMSKRRLLQLVEEKHVSGWDDPRMPTLAGMRRRGYTPESLREFCARVGVARNLSLVDVAVLEHAVREDLDPRSPRVLAVLSPLELVVENWAEGRVEELPAPYFAEDSNASAKGASREGTRTVPFSRVLYIEQDDFMESPPKDFHRMAPGRTVRLRFGYIVTCIGLEKDASGAVTRVRCTVDEATRGGAAPAGMKVGGTIHWVSAAHALDVEVRLYDRLFTTEVPGGESGDFRKDVNPASLAVVRAKVEPSLRDAKGGDRFQFERLGYFFVDPVDAKAGAPVFNRTVALKDGWARAQARAGGIPAKERAERPAKAAPVKAPAAALDLDLDEGARALRDAHRITAEEARTLSAEPGLRALFEESLAAGAAPAAAASLLSNDVLGELRARKLAAPPFDGAAVAELLALLVDGTLSTKLAKDVLAEMLDGGGRPRAIVLARGMRQIRDVSAIEAAVDRVLVANADAVGRYRSGNANVLGALVGLALKETGGKADPKLVREALAKKLTA